MSSLLSSRNSSIFELYIYKLDTISPLILNTFPPPSSPHFSHSLPNLSFIHQVPDPLVPWRHFLSWSGQSKTYADVQNMIYFMSLTFLLHFFPQKLIQFYCWRKLSFHCTKTKNKKTKNTLLWKWQHFSLGQNGGLWILSKRKQRHDMKSSFSYELPIRPSILLTGVNFISSRIKQFLG